VKLVLKKNRFFVETSDAAVFELLKSDPTIAAARTNDEGKGADALLCSAAKVAEYWCTCRLYHHADVGDGDSRA